MDRAQNKSPVNQNDAYFELAQEDRKPDYMIIKFRGGRQYLHHYAYLFNIDLIGNGKLVLEALSSRKIITLEGRGLDELAFYLMDGRVKWIREDENPVYQVKNVNIVINNITIEEA